ncbi:MAG TPA: molybdopterin-dependent oxidoreductase [Paracoccaceae bacterium]|nr:molybdopterin-dependent oxidoreductase [Paracoccaceae bacterium]
MSICAVLILGQAAGAAEPILTLANPSLPAASATILLDEAAMAGLPQKAVRTSNEFVDGVTEFAGPLARDVIAMIGRGAATRALLIAANDYRVEVDLEEFEKYDVIFATSVNGAPLSRRDKGPVWVIYPMDQHPELQDPSYNNRLVWQLVRVELR